MQRQYSQVDNLNQNQPKQRRNEQTPLGNLIEQECGGNYEKKYYKYKAKYLNKKIE